MWKSEIVHAWEFGLLYVDGRFVRELQPGRHRLRTLGRKVEVLRLPNAPLVMAAPVTDVITKDRFALRLGAMAFGRITDARKLIENQRQYASRFQVIAAEALAAVAAERTLDILLDERPPLSADLFGRLSGKLEEIEIESVTLTSMILPPEIRRMLTEAERAKREAEAGLERARGEHAALRSLANAARLLKDNPDLMRLRTLQAVSPTGKGATLVLGQDALGAPRSAD